MKKSMENYALTLSLFLTLYNNSTLFAMEHNRPNQANNRYLRNYISKAVATMSRMPHNFSWIDSNQHVGGMALPRLQAHMRYLVNHNVGGVITLTEDPLPANLHIPGIVISHIPVNDFTAPTQTQITQVVDIISAMHAQGKAVVIHCLGGMGRTGTMLACWLIKNHYFSAEAAINKIRELRPGSIETQDQINAIYAFEESELTLSFNNSQEGSLNQSESSSQPSSQESD